MVASRIICLQPSTALKSPLHSIKNRFSNIQTMKSQPGHFNGSSEQNAYKELDLMAFSLIIDDLVFWDGTTNMGVLGGGGSQTLYGYRLWRGPEIARVALAAGVGTDLPLECLDWFARNDINTEGLITYPDYKTPRAWQILEQDGRRHEIWRTTTPRDVKIEMLMPPLASLPFHNTTKKTKAYHVCIDPSNPPLEFLQSLREAACDGGLLSVETFTHAKEPVNSEILRQVMSLCDVFSPNEREAVSIIYGDHQMDSLDLDNDLTLLTKPFVDAGAKAVVTRRGGNGCVVHEVQSDGSEVAYKIPAIPGTKVVDVTGCGNAFCGGLIAGLQEGQPLSLAAVCGNVSGSILAEYKGLPTDIPAVTLRDEAMKRARLVSPEPLHCQR